MICRLSLRLASANNRHVQLISQRQCSALSYIHNTGKEPLRPLTFGKLLEQTAQTHGDTAALISRYQNKSLTFIEVLEQADRLAAGFRAIGLQYGDRVGLWSPNSLEWYVTFMAAARSGLNIVALNPAYIKTEMEYCIQKAGMKAIVCAEKFKKQNYYEILNQIAPEIRNCDPGKLKNKNVPSLESVIIWSDQHLKGTYNYQELIDKASDGSISSIKKNQNCIKIDDPVYVQFTSGTTGKPKSAVISNFQLTNNGYFVGKNNELNKKQHKICVQVPFFHAFGLVITISGALNHAATLVVPSEGYDPNKNLDAIAKENCTVIHGTPTMYVDLVNVQKQRQEKIKPDFAVSGGAPCSPKLFNEIQEVLNVKKVKSVFGLSETTAVVFQSLPDDANDEYKSTSTVGYVHEHVEAKVVDDKGNLVPRGTPGELCIRSYSVMLEYWEDREKTREILGRDRWLKTGDQFVLEENGYGRIVGRLKEMIIRGGENIFPKEIEDFLNTHPDILETYVIGLPHERLGEEVCACVRVREGATPTLELVREFCKGNIAHFKIPSVLRVMESFPKTTSGKIQKFKLIEEV